MNKHSDLSKITQITNNIFLSGICPLKMDIIKKLNIKYILSCVDRNYIAQIHNQIIISNPNITILYLPYEDVIDQNLWQKNNNNIEILKYTTSTAEYDIVAKQLTLYQNKPMIEIAYHFINNAIVANENILIHCMAGVSRSVSMTVYFLMKKYFLTFESAMQVIKSKRSIANPNNSFKLQLVQYQTKRASFNESDANQLILYIKQIKDN